MQFCVKLQERMDNNMSSARSTASPFPADYSALHSALEAFYFNYNPVHGYLSTFLCTFGVVVNLANIVVLTRPTMRNAVNVILSAVALCDIGLMTSYLIFLFHTILLFTDRCDAFQHYAWAVFHLIHANFSMFAHALSLYLTVLMALVRYFVLRTPQQSTLSSTRTGIWSSVATAVAIFILCIPNYLTFEIKEVSSQCQRLPKVTKHGDWLNATQETKLYFVDFAKSSSTACIASFWMNGLVFKMLPCLLLTVFMALLVHVMVQAAARRRRLHLEVGSNRSGDRTTMLLLLIVIVFLLTELPQGILAVLSGLMGPVFYERVYKSLGDVLDLLALLNSAVNFVLYCSMSQKFRRVFCETFLPKWLKKSADADAKWKRASSSRTLWERQSHVTNATNDDACADKLLKSPTPFCNYGLNHTSQY